jgi:hypothetical protein
MNAQILAALGLPGDADAASVLSALADLKAAVDERSGMAPHDLDGFRSLAGNSVEYERRERELETQDRERQDEERRERLLAVAVDESRIKDHERDALRDLWAIDPEAVKDVLLSVPGPDASRDVREIINAAGEVVDARSDSDWLHARAAHLLAEQGIAAPTEEEYAEALKAAGFGQEPAGGSRTWPS